MLKIILLFLCLITSDLSLAQGSRDPESLALSIPILSPNEAVKLAENYLIQVKHLDSNKFSLSGVRFEYYSSIPAPDGVVSVGWIINFDCEPEQLDCGFSVGISNTKVPKVVMYPVL